MKNKFNKVYFTEQLYNGNKWDNYRLGDVFLMSPSDRFYNPDFKENVLYHTTDYPGSIAAEYILFNKNKKFQNFELLNKIIKSRLNNFSISENNLILHIRVGDVLCSEVWIDQAATI